jgi:hypothetical protein
VYLTMRALLNIYMAPSDVAAITQAAKDAGISRSEWIRRACSEFSQAHRPKQQVTAAVPPLVLPEGFTAVDE